MQNLANGIRFYTHKIGRMESGEWNSRLHRHSRALPRIEEDRANGIRVYTNTHAPPRVEIN